MTLFLTSSPCLGWAGDLNPANAFLDTLRQSLPHPLNCLFITSSPDDIEMTDRMAWEMREIFERADLAFDHYEVLDRRQQRNVSQMLRHANFVILAGGHVPTENRFFTEMHLRQRIRYWALQRTDSVMLSISAGSMNAANVVYSSPELEGESIDPNYKLYLRGLGLTGINILPHFQMLAESRLDGRRLIEDIIASHSYGHPIYCLPDGSWFHIKDIHVPGARSITTLYGEAYLMLDGKLSQITSDGDVVTV